mmetsp:Transcript_29898/g.80352  ORF Transcript_29898/g.80352 Transcript_29898/m.80352 type:complete len:292 (+) Transcript_29898:2057-2932(+)
MCPLAPSRRWWASQGLARARWPHSSCASTTCAAAASWRGARTCATSPCSPFTAPWAWSRKTPSSSMPPSRRTSHTGLRATRRSSWCKPRSGHRRTSSSWACQTGIARAWESAARGSREGRSSAWPSAAHFSGSHASSFSTRPPRPSMHRARRRCRHLSMPSSGQESILSSLLPTACQLWSTPTRSRWLRMAPWQRRARTTSSLQPMASMLNSWRTKSSSSAKPSQNDDSHARYTSRGTGIVVHRRDIITGPTFFAAWSRREAAQRAGLSGEGKARGGRGHNDLPGPRPRGP